MIDLKTSYLQEVQAILYHHIPQGRFLAFGSRVKGNAKRYSDLDIAIITPQPLPLLLLSTLTETYAESDLPFKVDLVDWHRISPAFQQHILQHYEEILPCLS